MNDRSIRDRLIEQEQRSPAFEEKFRKEMKKMMEKKLSLREKINWCLSTLLGLFFLVYFTYVAVTAPPGFPLLARIAFLGGALFGAVWATLGIWTVRRGSMNLLRHENATYGLSYALVLLALTICMVVGNQIEDKIKGVLMILTSASFFMIFGIPALFNIRINRTETALREHLLKLELKVAELAERLQQGK